MAEAPVERCDRQPAAHGNFEIGGIVNRQIVPPCEIEHDAIVITTGHFSPSAKTQAKAPGAKQVELVDGERLCDLLDEHGLGVMKTERREMNREWLNKV